MPQSLYFYAAKASLVDPNTDQDYKVSDGVGRLSIPLDFAFFENEVTQIKGILQSSEQSWQAVLPAHPEGADSAASAPGAGTFSPTPASSDGWEQQLLDLELAGWLLLAFIGGLILNVMPCVLPVLSLKVFSLLNHSGQSRAHALAHGLAYTLGVVASFVLLAAVLFSLRALGESIGWGFQLQNPGFVLVLGLVFFLFGLNLLGVFEIGSGLVGADTKVAGRKDLFGSFGVGVLAAVVGAPCVGPFVGGVSGVALQTNTFTGLLIFAMLGLGMASPFFFLAIFPKLVAYLPKPGPWMETFKQSMGFLLLAALVFLLYLLGQLAGVAAITAMLVVLLVSAIAAWIYGRWAAPGKSGKASKIAKCQRLARQAARHMVLNYLEFLRNKNGARPSYISMELIKNTFKVAGLIGALLLSTMTSAVAAEGWMTDFEAAKAKAAEKGKPMLLDFTGSDWCGWCIKLKKEVFSQDAFQSYAADALVLVEIDFPRGKEQSDEVKAQNEALAKKYGIRGFPTILLLSPEGELIGRTGYQPGGAAKYVAHLKEILAGG